MDVSKKVTLEQMLPIIEEKVSSGGEISIPVTGTSMYPTLQAGRDYVVLKKAPDKLKKGDIPLYRRENGKFVLHRIVGEDENGYILCGDNQTEKEYGIAHSQVIAVLVAVERDGRKIPIDSTFFYGNNKFHKQIHFFRRATSKVKRTLKKKTDGKKD